MTCSDSDGIWTQSPWLYDALTSHVRMVNDDSQGLGNIVLDSGADVSGLPLPYSGVGTPVSHDGSLFVDAQGMHFMLTQLGWYRFGLVMWLSRKSL